MTDSKDERPPPTVPEEKDPIKVVLQAQDCPVEAVTVFTDRAEVTRLAKFTPETTGSHEVVIEEFSSKINTDSVRVNGKGEVVILEVSFEVHTKSITHSDDKTKEIEEKKNKEEGKTKEDRVRELRKELAEYKEELKTIDQAKKRLTIQSTLLSDYARTASNPDIRSTEDEKTTAHSSLDKVKKVTEYYFERLAAIDSETNKLNEKKEDLDKKISAIQSQITALGVPIRQTTKQSHDVTVGLNVKKVEEIELRIVYMVRDASWSPSYDVRISSKDNTFVLTYYGLVKQQSEENWKNTRLSLSTAAPQLGGTPPHLPLKQVRWWSPPAPAYSWSAYGGGGGGPPPPGRGMAAPMPSLSASSSSISPMKNRIASLEGAFGGAPPPPPEAQHLTAETSSDAAGTATFIIPRQSTIDCDGKPKKVTVALLTLESRFTHYAVPSLAEHAYLKAVTYNTSDFPLLPSPNVNIFFDNNFVSKSSIKAVSPGEDFEAFLGVDPAVKIEQKPLQKVRDKKGMISKENVETYKQITTIKNAKKVALEVVMKQQLPLSTDTKIKVIPVSPTEDELKQAADREQKKNEQEAQGATHSSHPHPLTKLVEPSNKDWICDVCKGRTAIRYRCSKGCDYDVCETCWNKEKDGAGTRIKLDPTTNLMEWTLKVPPGGKIDVPFSYSVKWPQDRQISFT